VHQTSGTRLTEIIVAFIICALIAYTALTSQNNQQTFLLLGIYAGASFRMLPSLNRMLNAQMQIKSHEYLFQELNSVRDFKIFQNQKEEPSFRFEKTIELQNITFQYPAGAKVLDHASLTINKGDKIALVGKSGSGKTTVLLLILHFLKGEGKIRVDGREIHDENLSAWRRTCSYVPQNPYMLDATIMENIAFGLSSADINVERIRELIRDLDLQEMLDQLPEGLSTQIGERGIKLSGGQRQRIAIARALYGGAEVLLFDEITNQLDARTEMEIIHTLEKVAHQKKTILMITHHDHLLKEFGRILSLENGVISEMSPVQTSHG
jgi:ABC-type multidrug transport system fused ATPase/permease subunit